MTLHSQGTIHHNRPERTELCHRCYRLKPRPTRTPWCRRCRGTVRHQQARQRGIMNSIWTRRLQARLKHDQRLGDTTGRKRQLPAA